MKNIDFRTVLIYFLAVLVFILLIVLRQMGGPKKELLEIEKEIIKQPISDIENIEPRGIIGLIIDDFGYRNDEISNGFLLLDVELTCAIIPGHAHSGSFGRKAIENGQEVIVHMPMENLGKNKGEKEFVLKTGMDSDSVIDRVNKAFDEIPEAIGLNNHQGSKATSDSLLMTYVGSVLKKRNKFFIDSRTTSETVAEETMSRLNVLTNRRNIFLDNELDKTKITKQLMSLVNIAERDGSAIGIGHVKVETLNVLKEQIPLIKEKGFKFEFVSKMLDK
tara:strand:+ start:54518 stop:55348 length:831 start_codon:yes stop_codon:yes gene_type:complete